MSLIKALWQDESGLIMSAETVTLGTVGVLGSIVGLTAAGNAVNDELKEMARAFRSLDQSYGYLGHRSCRAWTAGSCYIQQDVATSLAEINAEGAVDARTIQQQIEDQRKAVSQPVIQPKADALPNDLPKADPKPAPEPTVVPAKP